MLSAAASLGTILLWDVDGGLTQIDKYLYSSEDYIKVGGTDPSMGPAAAWGSFAVGWARGWLGERLALPWSAVRLSSCPEMGRMPCVPGFCVAHSRAGSSWGLP